MRRFVRVLKPAPTAYVVDEDHLEIGISCLDVLDQLLQRFAPINDQPAPCLVGIGTDDHHAMRSGIRAIDKRLVVRRVFLPIRRAANVFRRSDQRIRCIQSHFRPPVSAMLSTVGVNFGFAYVLRIALWLRTSGPAMRAPAAAPAAVARQVLGTGARVAGRVILLAAFLDDALDDLLVGERFGKSARQKREKNHSRKLNRPVHGFVAIACGVWAMIPDSL